VSRARFVLALLGVVGALVGSGGVGCSSCSRGKEPEKDPGYDPTKPDALAAPPISKAQAEGMTEREFKDWHKKITWQMCDRAFFHQNTLEGRAETEASPESTNTRRACIGVGNAAWFRCATDAQSKDALDACNKRFLRQPD
jgi:hypothetical protein